MPQLTSVSLAHFRVEREHLELLKNLPHVDKLRYVSLAQSCDENLGEVAASWHDMPLCTLHMQADSLTPLQFQELMQHVSAASQLQTFSSALGR